MTVDIFVFLLYGKRLYCREQTAAADDGAPHAFYSDYRLRTDARVEPGFASPNGDDGVDGLRSRQARRSHQCTGGAGGKCRLGGRGTPVKIAVHVRATLTARTNSAEEESRLIET